MNADVLARCRNPVALRRNRMFETVDVDETRDCISAILQPHELTPMRGWQPSRCYLDHISLGDVGIGAIRFGEMRVHVPELADYHLFITCLSGHAEAIVEQEAYRIDPAHGLIIAPGEEMLASFSPGCEQLFVRIGKRTIAEHSGFRTLQFRRAVELGNPVLTPWLQLIAAIASDPGTSELIQARSDIAVEYERLLLSLLLAGQTHQDAEIHRSAVAPKSVKKAEEFIHSRYFDPLTLGEIATASGVPTRTLLESFRNFRSTSPIRYLRDVRLDNARQMMIAGAVSTVAEAAMESGMMHLGRFSREYCERFGEKPSETMRLNRFVIRDVPTINFPR